VRALLIALSLVVFIAGCPRQTRKTLTPDVPKSGDQEARSRFLEARSKFLRDGGQAQDFKAIAQDFPSDPIVPWAELYAGIAAVKQRQFPEAEKNLGSVIDSNVDPALTARAKLFLGIAKNYQGDAAAARQLLAGADKAVENDDERTEFLAAVAYSTAAGDKPLQALGVFDQLYPRVTPTEKALIVVRCQELVASADRSSVSSIRSQTAEARPSAPSGAASS
jgi:hypothetical protein